MASKRLTCEQCKATAKSAAGLASHRRSKHPEPDAPATVAGAVDAGNRQQILAALERRLAQAVDEASTAELLPLTKQLLDVMAQLHPAVAVSQSSDQEGSAVDEIARRRRDRRAAATGK